MRYIKGHLIEYKNKNSNDFNYILRGSVGKEEISYYMHDSRIMIGLTR
jgi:hypothetical protein